MDEDPSVNLWLVHPVSYQDLEDAIQNHTWVVPNPDPQHLRIRHVIQEDCTAIINVAYVGSDERVEHYPREIDLPASSPYTLYLNQTCSLKELDDAIKAHKWGVSTGDFDPKYLNISYGFTMGLCSFMGRTVTMVCYEQPRNTTSKIPLEYTNYERFLDLYNYGYLKDDYPTKGKALYHNKVPVDVLSERPELRDLLTLNDDEATHLFFRHFELV